MIETVKYKLDLKYAGVCVCVYDNIARLYGYVCL